jgi:hypothetical protein
MLLRKKGEAMLTKFSSNIIAHLVLKAEKQARNMFEN